MDLFAEDLDFARRAGGGLPAIPHMAAGEHARTWITFLVVCFFVSAVVPLDTPDMYPLQLYSFDKLLLQCIVAYESEGGS